MSRFKIVWAILLILFFAGFASAQDDVKIIRMKGQTYKIWTDKNGIRRIDPVYLVGKPQKKSEASSKASAEKNKPKEKIKEPEKVEEADPGVTVVEEMDYEVCRQSLAAAESMATVYNVIFDYPKGKKFTVLMVVDNKTVQLKCEYGNRVTTTWEN